MKPIPILFLMAASALAVTPEVAKTIQAIGQKCLAAHEYSFEGELLLVGQRAGGPVQSLAHAKVNLALAPDGKFFLRIEPEGTDAYVLVSNGQKSWAWVPRLKQYTEERPPNAKMRAAGTTLPTRNAIWPKHSPAW
ncbi:MAG TPA: hypothetical protein VGL72_17580 [Bryobacteraceae bacterium]